MAKKPKKPKKCPICGKRKADVRRRPDQYQREIYDDNKAIHTACDDCDLENGQFA